MKKVNIHHHTKACHKYNMNCRFSFPKFPALKTIISVPIRMIEEDPEKRREIRERSNLIKKKVLEVLEDETVMTNISNVRLGEIEELLETNFQEQELESLLRERLVALLRAADICEGSDDDILNVYHEALSLSPVGYRVILKRDVNEIFVNNYNPEWVVCWNANMDLQFCFDYFAIITYISDYYGKDDSGTVEHIQQALNESDNQEIKDKLILVAQTFITHRQIGECEAYFRLLPHLQMKHSNVKSIFVPTGFKENRSKFLKQITEEEAKKLSNVVKIEGDNRILIEKPSLIDKYLKMDRNINPMLNQLTYLQFCKHYSASSMLPKSGELQSELVPKDADIKTYFSVNFIVTHNFDVIDEVYLLPRVIQLTEHVPGEPKFMRLYNPKVARFHKFSQLKSPHEFYFSELQLYMPFRSESELEPDSLEMCKAKYDTLSEHNGLRKVTNVKKILMEHLEDVTEGTERAKELINSNVEDILDAQNAQENIDCELEGNKEHESFEVIDPENLDLQDESIQESKYRKIELVDDSMLIEFTKKLDSDQRMVLDRAVSYAKDLRKSNRYGLKNLKPPLLVVQGGA